MKKPEIVPASLCHFSQVGEIVRNGRAFAVVLEGRAIGITGYYLDSGRLILYSKITPELRPWKKIIVLTAKMIIGLASKIRAPLDARSEPETPGSECLLLGLGFKRLEGEVFRRLP